MKRTALLTALCLALAGCASAPSLRPTEERQTPVSPAPVSPAPVSPAPVSPAPVSPAPVSPASVSPAPVSPAPVSPAPVSPAPVDEAPPAPPAPKPAAPADQPASNAYRLKDLVRVATPAAGDLGAAYRDPERMNNSAWSIAEAGLHFIYTGRPALENALAPALAERFRQAPPVAPAARVWTTFASSWDENQERFYFHLQVTARDLAGTVHRAGVDVIEVSHVPGYGYLVTGFAHAPWASEQGASPVQVWTGPGPDAYQAPREVPLPALPLLDGGQYLVPLAVVDQIGQAKQVGASTYVVELAAGATSAELTAVTRNGLPYVYAEDLVQALNGRHGALPDASGSYSYQAEWHPESHQLFLWADLQHRMS